MIYDIFFSQYKLMNYIHEGVYIYDHEKTIKHHVLLIGL